MRKVAWPGRRAAPDRLFAHGLRGTVWIEFKRPGEDATLAQKQEHTRMRAAGMEVHVCDNVELAMKILWIGPDGKIMDPSARGLV